MATTAGRRKPRIREITREEGLAMLDAQTRRYLGMSAEEFIRKWDAGEFDEPDPDTQPHLIRLSMLIPGAR